MSINYLLELGILGSPNSRINIPLNYLDLSFMYTDLLNLFSQIAEIDEKETELIKNSFKSMTLKKGSFFLEAGDICKNVGYIKEGLVRYYVNKNGAKSTFEFTKEGQFISDYQSFNEKQPTVQNIQAIEDCKILIINHPNTQNLFGSLKNGNLIGRIILEHRFCIIVNRLLEVYMQNHEDRYRNFVKNYADLTQRIPQYMIASYVGVSPSSLSRIRSRFGKGNES